MKEIVEYVIISDRSRKDYGCPGYIQSIMDNPVGKRMIVRIYTPEDQDSMGTQHCLDPEQIQSVTSKVFHRLLKEIKINRLARNEQHYMIKEVTMPSYMARYQTEVEKYCKNDAQSTFEVYHQRCVTPKKIIYNPDNLTTTVLWMDGTITIVRCSPNDEFSEYNGFIAALAKKVYGGTGPINQIIKRNKTYQKSKKKRKSFEEILDEAAEKAAEGYKELPPDPLEHPEFYSR
nr:MAG TPA: hypothetical protein [Caudoviricetes sp.]